MLLNIRGYFQYKVPGYIEGMSLPTPAWAVGGNTPTKTLQKPEIALKGGKNKPELFVKAPDENGEIDYGADAGVGYQIEVPDEIRVLSANQNLGDGDFILLSSAALLAQLPKEERVLRTTFVREYLYDFDPLLAAIRVGFLNVRMPSERFSPAMEVARALMAEPVIQRLIKECMLNLIKQDDAENIFIMGLIREATNHSITGNAAARNGALKHLSDVIKEARANREGTERVKGNIMLMPKDGETFESWEKGAMASQQALRDSVRA